VAGRADVTAIFAANDQMALGVMRAVREAGRLIPRDVSVIGFDDTPESGYFHPALTTVRQDFAEVGRRSVALLLAIVEGTAAQRHLVVDADVVVRNSTAPPP
jgi:DNA-binding LacI/PurR family transcriptional regulator